MPVQLASFGVDSTGDSDNYAGRVKSTQIDDLTLTTRDGAYDIKAGNALVQMNLYEDIFHNFTTGNIIVLDNTGWFERGPICGDETLSVSFKPDSEFPGPNFTKDFIVYKTSLIGSVHGSKTRTYQLELATHPFQKNLETRIRRSYKGKLESEIVQLIAKNQLGIDDLEVEATKYPRNIVIPGWRPLSTINYLARSSVRPGGYPASNYVFFETAKDHKFCSIDKLMEAGQKWKLQFHLARISDPASLDKILNAKDYRIRNTYDNVRNGHQGMFAHRLWTQDLLRKKVESHDYLYESEFDSQVHVDDSGVKLREDFSSELDQRISFYPKQKDYANEHADDHVKRRAPMMQSLMNYAVEADTEGNTNVMLGDVCKFDLFSNQSGNAELDKRLSGNLLVTRIMHSVNYKEHRMTLELRKDCLKTD